MERGALSWMLLSASSCKRQQAKSEAHAVLRAHNHRTRACSATKTAHCVWMNPRLA